MEWTSLLLFLTCNSSSVADSTPGAELTENSNEGSNMCQQL